MEANSDHSNKSEDKKFNYAVRQPVDEVIPKRINDKMRTISEIALANFNLTGNTSVCKGT